MKSRGYTLIELAVVIAITGVIMVMAAGFALPLMETARRIETEEKMARVARALAFYVVRNDRLPCPGAPDRGGANPPFGYERGSGAAGVTVPANCGAAAGDRVGIVPFATIGLTEGDITDGYGNPFTYAVSPAFTLDTGNAALTVHPRCRTRDWFYADGAAAGSLIPRNPTKARYCCPGENPHAPATDIIVRDSAGNSVLSFAREANESAAVSTSGLAYETADQPFALDANVFVPLNDRPVAVNYALISHGNNGLGAYILNGGGQQAAPPAGTLENENSNGDNIFRDIAKCIRSTSIYF